MLIVAVRGRGRQQREASLPVEVFGGSGSESRDML